LGDMLTLGGLYKS